MRILRLIALISLLAACNPKVTSTSLIATLPVERTDDAALSQVPTTPATLIAIEPIKTVELDLANSYQPQPGDAKLTRGFVFLNSSHLNIMESYPIQVSLNLEGSLPTPCNQLRVEIQPPDGALNIFISVYSVVDPNQICIEVLKPFTANVPLGSFLPGHYTVWVDETRLAEFDS
jgi:hypothetical protein